MNILILLQPFMQHATLPYSPSDTSTDVLHYCTKQGHEDHTMAVDFKVC